MLFKSLKNKYAHDGIKHNRNNRELRSHLHVLRSLLTTSHGKETIKFVLKELRDTFAADAVCFFSLDSDGTIRSYEYESDELEKPFLEFEKLTSFFLDILQYLEEGQVFAVKNKMGTLNGDAAEVLEKYGIHNMSYFKIEDSEHKVTSILFAFNIHKMIKKNLFENIAHLLRAYISRVLYIQKLENMSKYDSLTGLLNRNSYQSALAGYENMPVEKLFCIYVDLNGLHNINNKFGHERGDKMLRRTAKVLADNFDSDSVFRIGGDEFVVLYEYESESDAERRIKNMKQQFGEINCNVSVGADWCDDSSNIDDSIKRAEAKMFKEKDIYYKTEKRI